jgi:hypothetical protein
MKTPAAGEGGNIHLSPAGMCGEVCMLTIYHISDLHISRNESANDGARELLARIGRIFDSQPGNKSHLLITGDITESGSRAEYLLALEALIPFRNRIFVVPGNHDYGGLLGSDFDEVKARRFDTPFADSLGINHAFFAKLDPAAADTYSPCVQELDDGQGTRAMLIGLNSCRSEGVLDFAQGEIGATQLIELDRILDSGTTQDIPKILALHHIPIKHARFPNIMSLLDWEAVMRTINDRVDVIAFGHQSYEQSGGKWLKVSRDMSVMERTSPRGKRFLLDADASVDERSCYAISIEQGAVNAKVRRMGPRQVRKGVSMPQMEDTKPKVLSR